MDELAREILKDIALEEIGPKSHKRSPVDHWTPAVLLERAAYLKKMARYGDGTAGETLRTHSQHEIMLQFKSRDGDAELHEGYAFLFVVLAGTATLVTGGTLTRPRKVGAGETHGDAIDGGVRQELKQGEVAHVPAGQPYQFLVAGEKSIACLVVKIQEAV